MGDVVELFAVLATVTGVPLLAYLAYALIQRHVVRGGGPLGGDAATLRELRERVARLEQAVDVVAVEVERVGEAQRFTARLLADRPGTEQASTERANTERVGADQSAERGAP